MLSDLDRQILDFERTWWKYAGAKEADIKTRFGMTGTRYYQQLNAIIDKPEALQYDAVTVKRLQRQRIAKQRARDPRRVGLG